MEPTLSGFLDSHNPCIGEQDWFYPIKQDSRLALAKSQIQARFENLFMKHLNFKQDTRSKKVKISTSSKIREFKIQNIDFKQYSRIINCVELAAM